MQAAMLAGTDGLVEVRVVRLQAGADTVILRAQIRAVLRQFGISHPHRLNKEHIMKRIALFILSLGFCCAAQAQGYGPNVTLEQAKTVLAAAEAEAVKQNLNVAIAIVDTSGNLVAYIKRDDTQLGSVNVSQGKARSAALFKRATKAFQDTVAAGGEGLRVMTLEGVVAAEGGVPLMVNGAIVGAIGVSGGTSAQDGSIAAAGVAVLK
jgi:glc operon protein GlcG